MTKQNNKHVILLISLALELAACGNKNTPDNAVPTLPEESAAYDKTLQINPLALRNLANFGKKRRKY